MFQGFTTGIGIGDSKYTQEQVDEMIQVLRDNGYLNRAKKITFPIRAIFAGKIFSQ